MGKTHRLGGKLMIAAGLLMIVAVFLPIEVELIGMLTMGAVLVAALVPIVYSFLLWRRETKSPREPSE